MNTAEFEKDHHLMIPKKAPLGPYSFSQLSLFEKCPRQYWLKYVCKMYTPPTKPLRLGNAIHGAIEDAINVIKRYNPEEIRSEKFAAYLKKQEVESDLRAEYGKAIDVFSKWIPGFWKFARSVNGEVCAEFPFGLDEKYGPMQWDGNIRATPPKGMLLRGSIDLSLFAHLHRAAVVIDHKSGKNDYKVFEKDVPAFQLGTYALAVFAYFPHVAKVGTSFYNLMNHMSPEDGATFTPQTAWEYAGERIKRIVEDIRRRDWKNPHEWEPLANKYCDFCDFKKGCPLYQAGAAQSKGYTKSNSREITDASLDRALERLSLDEILD